MTQPCCGGSLSVGVDDQNFADGARFVVAAGEFKAATGLAEGLSIKTTQVVTVVTAARISRSLQSA